MTRQTSKPANLLVIGIIAAFLASVVSAMGNITARHMIVSVDSITSASAYLVIGSWTGTVVGLLCAISFGRQAIDRDFKKITLGTARMQIFAFLSGLCGAIGTFFVLWSMQFGDPGAVIALTTAGLVYVGLYDLFTKKTTLQKMAVPVLAATIGSTCAAFTGSVEMALFGAFLLLVCANGAMTASEIFEQKGLEKKEAREAIDAVSMYVWRFFWFAISATILALCVSVLRNTSTLLVDTIISGSLFLPFVILTMIVQFVGGGLKTFLKRSKALSMVLVIMALQVVFAFPITILGEFIEPNLFGGLTNNPFVWGVRFAGALLLVWGVVQIKKIDEQVR